MEIASSKFEIIVLTETRLNSSIKDAEIFGREYHVYRRDRQHGGCFGSGVLITMKCCLKVSPRKDFACESELLFIYILTANIRKTRKIVMSVYRLPNIYPKVFRRSPKLLSNIKTNNQYWEILIR